MRGDSQCVEQLDEGVLSHLIKNAAKLFLKEPSCLRLKGKFVVVGDIHGNVDSLIRILERFRYPPHSQYLFLGDFVDRGPCSIEVLLLLYILKINFPNHIYLIRGNHETRMTSKVYGFQEECIHKLGKSIYKKFLSSFARLPFAAIINDAVFCVHGGIAQSIQSIEEIDRIERPLHDITESDAIDLLWSDPSKDVFTFVKSERGIGCIFGSEPLNSFLEENGLTTMIRAHEYFQEGYNWTFGNEGHCLTVFSSCDYCGMGNKSAAAIVDENNEIKIETFLPMNAAILAKRRILIPDWVLASQIPPKAPITIKNPQVPLEEFTIPICF